MSTQFKLHIIFISFIFLSGCVVKAQGQDEVYLGEVTVDGEYEHPIERTETFMFECPGYDVEFVYSYEGPGELNRVRSVSIDNQYLPDAELQKISKVIRETGELRNVDVNCMLDGDANLNLFMVRLYPTKGDISILSSFKIKGTEVLL